MGRFGKVGVFRQVGHPHIRGDLDPSHTRLHPNKVVRLEDHRADEETYFVPSFSIRRHLHQSEEPLWEAEQKMLKGRLGRGFDMTPPQDVSLKIVEQHRLIKNIRAAGIRPEPEQVRDLAYSIRDNLTDLLSNARSPLQVPLGNFGRFGYKKNAVAYELDGWRGERAQYAHNDEEGFMDPFAVLLAERRLAVGAIALAFEGTELSTDGLAPSPHMTVARHKDEIPDYRLREIRGELSDIALDEVELGDPVIGLKLYRDEPAVFIPIRHAWESLAHVQDSFSAPARQTELNYIDPYETFADAYA